MRRVSIILVITVLGVMLVGCLPGVGPRPTATPVATRIPTLVPTAMPTVTPIVVLGQLPEQNQVDKECNFAIPAGRIASNTLCRFDSGIYKVKFESQSAPIILQFQNKEGDILSVSRVDQQLEMAGGSDGDVQIIGVAISTPLSLRLKAEPPALVSVTTGGEPINRDVTVKVTKQP